MRPPPFPPEEQARLAAVKRFQALEKSHHDVFESLTAMASTICQAPMSTITVVDESRAWFLAAKGMGALTEAPRDVSVCSHAILDSAPLIIEDMAADAKFQEHPFVTGEPLLRFYVGLPLVTHDGFRIGSICAMDVHPKQLTEHQLTCLTQLAGIAAKSLELQLQALKRLEAEHELDVSKARLQFALDAAEIGDWDMDLRTNIARRSLRHDICFGYTEPVETWGYDTFLAHVHPAHRARVDACFQTALAGNGIYDIEFQAVWPDNSIHWLWSKGTFYFDEAGKPYRVAGIQVDVTKRRESEDRHLSLEAQLRESQKLEAMGTLAGGVAHEFNNVLGIIQGNVALAMEDAAAIPLVMESLNEIQKASSRGRDVVQQILSFSRRQPTEKKRINAIEVVTESLRFLRSTVPPIVTISLDVPHIEDGTHQAHEALENIEILADTTQVQQVVINLATNAVHALDGGGGNVQVGIRCVMIGDNAAGETTLKPGAYACISVQDNGRGMDAATRARIFEPFFTTKPTGEGTGLGLSVVHGIVLAHGGAITVESSPGNGTTFKTFWPLASAVDALPTAQSNSLAKIKGGTKHVLYLDDDASMVVLFQKLLSRRGFRVSGFTSATDAVAALKAAPSDYDAMVTDYNMPAMTGLEIAAAARTLSATLPVIIISGFITDELRAAAQKLCVREVVAKPNSAIDLCNLLVTVLTD